MSNHPVWPDDYLIPGVEPYHVEEAGVIYCADCRDILPKLPKVDLVLTDPPYPNQSDIFTDSIQTGIDFCQNYQCNEEMIFWSEIERPPLAMPLVAVHIWHRTNVNGKIYEPIYHFRNDGIKKRSEIKRGAAIFNGAGAGCAEYLGHPTQKPIHIMKWLVGKSKANIILDPFLGSGTTAVAAKELGRKFIGIEISETYAAIAVKRLKHCNVLPFSDEHNIKKGHGDTQNPMLNLMTL